MMSNLGWSMCLLVLTASAYAATAPIHVLFVLVDDLGYADVQFGPHRAEYTTPTITEWAENGTWISRAYTPSLCSPTRTSLLSGRYPYAMGLDHGVITAGRPYSLPIGYKTMGDALKSLNFQTFAYGKYDIGFYCKEKTSPGYRGFDKYIGYLNAAEDYFTHERGGVSGRYPNGSMFHFTGYDFQRQNGSSPPQAAFDLRGQYSTTILASEMVKDIESSDPSTPHFWYFAPQAVHSPNEVPANYINDTDCVNVTQINGRQIFCGKVKALDEGLSNITEALRAHGFFENTVMVFSGDNGPHTAFGGRADPLRGEKSSAFEGGYRTPTFVSTPRRDLLPPGPRQMDSTMVYIADWLPTIVEGILGGPNISTLVPQKVDGINVWPAISGKGAQQYRDHLVLHLDNIAPYYNAAIVRNDGAKVITGVPTWYAAKSGWDGCDENECPTGWVYTGDKPRTPPPAHNASLIWTFNLTADPLEKNDITATHWEVTQELLAIIEAVNKTTMPQLNPGPDYRSDPAQFQGAWEPWLSGAECTDPDLLKSDPLHQSHILPDDTNHKM